MEQERRATGVIPRGAYRLGGGLISLQVLFRLIHEYWARSGCPSVLLRAFLFLCTDLRLCSDK